MNHPVHFEIHADDPEKLVAFYTSVFGWTTQAIPEMQYWLIHTGEGGFNGGILKRRGDPPVNGAAVNAFVVTLGVESVDDMFAKAIAAGATEALGKMAIPGVGWQAYIKDPSGNILGLHQVDSGAK
jgi:predicted enzyme related to lactoylglutathione lyase